MEQEKTGKLISTIRKSKGLTQQELGDLIGVSSKTISKWECSNGFPDITYLKQICKILGITIEELLDGEIKESLNQQNTTKKKITKKTTIIIFLIILLILLIITIPIFLNKSNKIKTNNCTVIRTYYIDNIGRSNDENYLYITIHEFQVEGTYTFKLPMTISKDLEVGKSYEFTFKTNNQYIKTTTDKLFNNSEVINLKYTEKEGLERTSKYYCEGEDKNEKK